MPTPSLLRDPVLLNDWHPVALASQLSSGVLFATQLLDTPLVLWRDQEAQLHAWEDRCPHRGTKLSIGRLQGQHLQCAYHGWQFDGNGRCQHIPALPGLRTPPAQAQVNCFAIQERYGLLWVCLGTPHAAHADIPAFPEFADPVLRHVHCGPYEVRSSAPRIVENFLDMAHFATVHDQLLGTPEHASIPDYVVDSFDDPHYGQGIWAKQCRAWQPQASKAAVGAHWVDYTYRVIRPHTAILTKQYGEQAVEAISLHLQALTETTTRVWIIMALADQTSSDAELRAFQDTIFLHDLPILENQTPLKLPLYHGAEISVACDRLSLAYRRYLQQQSLHYGVLHAAA